MKRTTIVRTLAFVGVALVSTTARAKPGANLSPASNLKWSPVPGMTGIQMAVVDGDPAKGASHFFVKFDKGFAVAEHHHNADHYTTVISGTMVLTVDNQESKLGPGSYFSFTGKKPHATRCDPTADCVLMIDARGKWDVIPAKSDTTSADARKPAK